MKELLANKLHQYISDNNPDLLLTLESESSISKYILDKVDSVNGLLEQLQKGSTPAYIIEEICLNELTKDLKPSKFNYIMALLEEEFEFAQQQLSKLRLLQFEVVNMIAFCNEIFESFNFNEENEDNRNLRYAVTGKISEYLDRNL